MHARRAVVETARALGFAEGLLSIVALAVSEAVANAVVHGYGGMDPGDVDVGVEATNGSLCVTVRDFGVGMRPRSDNAGMGLGLPLIARTSHEFDVVAPPGGGTKVSMRFLAER